MASILCLQRRFKLLCIIFVQIVSFSLFSQPLIKAFDKDSLSHYLEEARPVQHKTIPAEYDSLVRIALLYYPELEKVHITFRVKKQVSPLMARPAVFSIFRRAAKRRYIISISSATRQTFTPILLKNLSLNSSIGVIGHELSHISDYNRRYGIYFFKLLFMHLDKRAMDKFEYATDMRCIAHGLGYQLLSWSREVRLKLALQQWNGIKHMHEKGRERYMNPESILKTMTLYALYYN